MNDTAADIERSGRIYGELDDSASWPRNPQLSRMRIVGV